ncbi:MAG: DUF1501 domain-containing protein [Planctomycetota bacterium]
MLFSEPFTRRGLCRSAAGGLATLLGMPVRGLVAREPGVAARAAQADAVILLWMGGGMSHIDTFDPKAGAKTGGEFTAIRTAVDGVTISEILPTVAAQLGHATLLRTLTGESADHGDATHHVLTSYPRVRELVHPSLGSIVADQVDRLGDLPAFVTIGGQAPSPGYLGQTAEAYFIGEPGQPDPTVTLPEGITLVRSSHRLELLDRLNKGFAVDAKNRLVDAVDGSYAAAVKLMRSPALTAFNLDDEPPAVREAYGDTRFGRGCLLARRLVDQGVRFVQVNLGGFDTHTGNFPAMRGLGAVIDPAIGTLLRDLAASGRLDRTLVLVLSEFGRTPDINGSAGRDHYPDVFSGLVAGGAIRRGFVLGATDPEGRKAEERPVRLADLHATVVAQLGIDPDREVPSLLGRNMKLVNGGRVIGEMLS